jgi:hypothetical protein
MNCPDLFSNFWASAILAVASGPTRCTTNRSRILFRGLRGHRPRIATPAAARTTDKTAKHRDQFFATARIDLQLFAQELPHTLHCTTLSYPILYYTMLYYTVLPYRILYYTIRSYTIAYYTTLYCSILYYSTRCYPVQYCTILYYTIYTKLCYALLCYDLLCFALFYHTILYYATLYYTNNTLWCIIL